MSARTPSPWRRAGFALTLLALVACQSRTLATRHIDIGPETLERIEPGSGRKFVLAVLGEPLEKVQLDDGMELWKWALRERETANGGVLYRVESEPGARADRRAYVEFKDGRVRRAWRD
jgi:hypothetical protein